MFILSVNQATLFPFARLHISLAFALPRSGGALQSFQTKQRKWFEIVVVSINFHHHQSHSTVTVSTRMCVMFSFLFPYLWKCDTSNPKAEASYPHTQQFVTHHPSPFIEVLR